MQIEQALYGEHRGGHSLLVSSGDEEVSTEIVQRLDLPDTAPPGVDWSPFLRGFPYRDRYVLSRTFHDTGASRGGMVFSHALLAPLDEIVEFSDLGPLLRLLATSDLQRPDAKAVQIVRTERQLPHTVDLIDTAEALGASGRLPVVRLGHIGFDDTVAALWAHLLPEIRRGFAFRLSFDPRDLLETPMPTLVCTPNKMAARWLEYPVIRSTVSQERNSLVASLLSGQGTAAPLIEFMLQMGVKPATVRDLRMAEQAYRLDIGEPTFERRVGVVRLVGKLSPDSIVGEHGKDDLLRQLCDLLPEARAEEVLQLRNLQLSAFPAPGRVWKALERWVAENRYLQDEDGGMLSVLGDATTDKAAVQDWRSAILDGLVVATGLPRSSFPRAFWRWLQVRPKIALSVLAHVPVEAGVEERLATETPSNLNRAAAESLEALALSRGWLRLHGAVLSARCSSADAARRQIAVDTDLSFVEGVRSALRQAKPAELVECALEIEDLRMPLLAGEAVAKDPRLLAEVDLSAIKAQAIWREALAINAESWCGPANPAAAFHAILDRLLDGGPTDASLIERLSDTPAADLGDYPRRPEIWLRIGSVALHNFLVATTKGWLGRAASVGVPFAPESHLQTAILESDELEQTLDLLIPDGVSTAVRIVAALDGYGEERFLSLIERVMSRAAILSTTDSDAIGRLVLEHRWEDAAARLIAQYKLGRIDVRPALRKCCYLLGVWDRIMLRLTPIPESEKWDGLQELAVELYPGGPGDHGLWERAGGDNADLPIKENGRTQWQTSVRNIRNGRGPTPHALLAEMMRDFPNNERIPHLAGDRDFIEGVGGEWRA